MSLKVPVCRSCGRAVFPERLLCPDCGARNWREEPVDSGVLESLADRGEVRVGIVRTALGPAAIVRVQGAAREGAEVLLEEDGGVPVARV